jgi:hypothetical protein
MPLHVCKVTGPRVDLLACTTGVVVWFGQVSASSDSYCIVSSVVSLLILILLPSYTAVFYISVYITNNVIL